MLCLNNCQYTQTYILPRIQKSFQEVGQLSLERPIAEACKCYNILHGKLFEAYLELKCDPIVSIVEPSMYVGKFDWARRYGNSKKSTTDILSHFSMIFQSKA